MQRQSRVNDSRAIDVKKPGWHRFFWKKTVLALQDLQFASPSLVQIPDVGMLVGQNKESRRRWNGLELQPPVLGLDWARPSEKQLLDRSFFKKDRRFKDFERLMVTACALEPNDRGLTPTRNRITILQRRYFCITILLVLAIKAFFTCNSDAYVQKATSQQCPKQNRNTCH